MDFSFLWLVAAFGGGIFGAAVGGLPAFVFTGIAAVVGAGLTAYAGDGGAFSGLVAWGPVLGPQIAFAGGVAAVAYAAKRGLHADGKDIGSALMGLNRPDVLLIGGLFGVVGYLLWWAFANLPMIGDVGATNPIALSIVVNGMLVRYIFGKKGAFGKVPKGVNRWVASDAGAWLPWQNSPLQLLVFGTGVGLAVSWTAVQNPALAAVWFGFAAISLVFLHQGSKAPVWHHPALAAEQVIALGAVAGATVSIWWGVAFAIFATFLGDFYGMLVTAFADTFIDPPSVTLFTTFTLMAILKSVGAFKTNDTVSLGIAVVVAVVCFGLATLMKGRKIA
jgi:hypothetical protein